MSLIANAIQYLLKDSNDPKQIQNFVNGEFVNSSSNDKINSEDPSVGEVWLQLPNSDEPDVDRAVDAATSAFENWSATSKEHRARLLNRVADSIEANADALAQLESKDQGKTVKMARWVWC